MAWYIAARPFTAVPMCWVCGGSSPSGQSAPVAGSISPSNRNSVPDPSRVVPLYWLTRPLVVRSHCASW